MCPTRGQAVAQAERARTKPHQQGQDGQDLQNWCELIRVFVYQTSHFEDTL